MSDMHRVFTGSIPQNYDRYLAPLIFNDYAADLAARITVGEEGRILETAAGTGIVTTRLRDLLPPAVGLVATDLNEAMVEYARTKCVGGENVEFRVADAMTLPFPEHTFDAVVCQFGVMFFPDTLAALREARRVLKPGGWFVFNVWDSLEHNHHARTVQETLARLFPADPPDFLEATVHSCYRLDTMKALLHDAGYQDIAIAVLPRRSRASSARDVTLGILTGTPLSHQLSVRAGERPLEEVLAAVEQAVSRAHGDAPTSAKMQALVFSAQSPTRPIV